MFEGVLLTLDINIWITENNKILFSFFEKEMVSPLELCQKGSEEPPLAPAKIVYVSALIVFHSSDYIISIIFL